MKPDQMADRLHKLDSYTLLNIFIFMFKPALQAMCGSKGTIYIIIYD
jgi:hypothetical protein